MRATLQRQGCGKDEAHAIAGARDSATGGPLSGNESEKWQRHVALLLQQMKNTPLESCARPNLSPAGCHRVTAAHLTHH